MFINLEKPGYIYTTDELNNQQPTVKIVTEPIDPDDLDAFDYETLRLLDEDVEEYWPAKKQAQSTHKTAVLKKSVQEPAFRCVSQ